MGILDGIRVVELGGLGPSAWACTFLADMGADVVRIDRPGRSDIDFTDTWMRGRSHVRLDLKTSSGHAAASSLVNAADVVVESFRPGVAERLGLGPEFCTRRDPRLVYAQMTGWGQEGPYAHLAGHDLNYLSIAGALDTLGPRGGKPLPTLYYVGDWASGTMLLITGIIGALYERERSGRGQVVDAAIVDGASLMLMQVMDLRAKTGWTDARGVNELDGGAWYYDTYETADGRHMALGAFEPIFRQAALRTLGLACDEARVVDRTQWELIRAEVTAAFLTRTQASWIEIFAQVDACVTPVRSLAEAAAEPHLRARRTYASHDGSVQAMPAPRFSRTPSTPGASAPAFDAAHWGIELP
ncbi:CoA transferase [Aeromicrobium tamlense]|uniref:Alpha-methylacyl-CoA racemase n=1 Tax=Aeromicrobium tamlense TaxID=375541 RepID=A0A8I0G1B8_9ACTN|nr:CaiB/BaiF CoA-transferase family protein [Aeromicrobium tamlense]MBD1270754.1 CoA transferase [Aeromicrobium tamlense]MBD1271114.1 CoA transferase [Aeromicrobium tamlense]NYI38146.1 alpha-methylacyl-CoA racemase [Aeromicrobium tamlense]